MPPSNAEPPAGAARSQAERYAVDLAELGRALGAHLPLAMAATHGESHLVLWVNPAFCRLTGRPAEAMIGHPFLDTLPFARTDGAAGILARVLQDGEGVEMEAGPIPAGGGLPSYVYSVAPLFDQQGRPQGLLVRIDAAAELTQPQEAATSGEVREANRHLLVAGLEAQAQAVELAAHNRALREASEARERLAVAEAVAAERRALLGRIVRAQEEERARVAREVHDSVTQLAHAAAMRLDNALDLLGEDPAAARAEVERGRDLARRAADEARRLIAGLRPEALDTLGLAGAVQQEVDTLRAAGWPVALEDGELWGVRLAPDAEITLFRVAQEALANVRRHAGRARVRVRLRRLDGHLRLEVRDWGRGFEPGATPPTAEGEHVGLAGMRERLHLLGGALEVRSGPEHGTTVRATLPLPPDAGADG